MRVEYIIIVVVAMILMLLFILMMIFRKKIFNFQKIIVLKQTLFSINDLISILGTKTNITMVKAILTRLQVTVKDLDEVDFVLLKTKFKLKDIDIVVQTVILPFGNISLVIKDEMNKIIGT